MSLSPTLKLSTSLLTFFRGDCFWHFRNFLYWPLFGLVIFRLTKFCLCVLNAWGFTRFIFCFHSMCSFNVFHQITFIQPSFLSSSKLALSSNLGVPTTTLDKGCKCANRWCWTKLYGPNPFYPTRTWVKSSWIKNLIFPFTDVPFFSHSPPP
jgi:hypothetical protein